MATQTTTTAAPFTPVGLQPWTYTPPTPAPTTTSVGGSSSIPVPKLGSKVTDTMGRTGIAAFDPNTGKPLTAPTTPAPVISSSTINKKVTPGIQNIIQTQDTNLQNADLEKKRISDLNATTLPTDEYNKGDGTKNLNYKPVVTPEVKKTPEDLIAEQPDDGNQWAYNGAGMKVQIPKGDIPTGYSAQDPTTRKDVSDSVSAGGGVIIKKFVDGTYGRFNTTTNDYAQVSSEDFNNAQRAADAQKISDDAKNGVYLPAQQAQIDATMKLYQDTIDKQIGDNTNMAYGINAAARGAGYLNSASIAQSFKTGLESIVSLSATRDKSIADMKANFEADDVQGVKDAFAIYTQNSQDIQKQIDQNQTMMQNAKTKLENSLVTSNRTNSIKYGVDIPDGATPQQARDILETSEKYKTEQEAVASLTPDENNFMGQMALTGVPINNLFTSVGMGAAGLKVKIPMIKAMIAQANSVGLSPQDLANSIMDKQSKIKAYTQLQKQGSLLNAQETKVEDDFKMVNEAGKKVTTDDLQSGIPFLQKWINSGGVNMGVLDDTKSANLNAYLGLLTTSLTNYARVVAGQTGAAGTTANMNSEIQGILTPGLSPALVAKYLNETAIPEMKNTTGGYDKSMKQLMSSLNMADGTVNATSTTGGLGNTSNTTTDTTKTDIIGTLNKTSNDILSKYNIK
jgi:hypothetical protein